MIRSTMSFIGDLRAHELRRAAGAHNGLTASLAARSGFDAVWASGLEISASHAIPDADILGAGDTVTAIESIVRASTVPVVVDCDAGYGNAMNALFMARRYYALGAEGLCLEDKVFPKINSFADARQPLEDITTFCGKVEAVRSARLHDDQFVVARTEALIAGMDVDEALARCHAYADVGADAVLIHDKTDEPDGVLEFAARWDRDVPLVAVPTTYHSVSAAELHAAGFSLVIYANQGLRAQIRAVTDTFNRILADGRSTAVEDDLAAVREIFELQGLPEFQAETKMFVR
jgi:phosphoenolpyruvate phosphomutase